MNQDVDELIHDIREMDAAWAIRDRHMTRHYHLCPHIATDPQQSHALWMIRDCRDDLRIDR